jgi:large subunit ribosomal protein L9
MQIILLERIEKLGQMGDVVTVKSGYARNFLLPYKKALRATEQNRARFATQRAQLEAQNLGLRAEATALAAKLNGLNVTLVRQAGEFGQLYGSVGASDIAKAVTAAGFTISRRQVVLQAPIKALGVHPIKISLHPEVAVNVNVNVARSEAEAQAQIAPEAAAQFFEEGAAPKPEDETAAEAADSAGDEPPPEA